MRWPMTAMKMSRIMIDGWDYDWRTSPLRLLLPHLALTCTKETAHIRILTLQGNDSRLLFLVRHPHRYTSIERLAVMYESCVRLSDGCRCPKRYEYKAMHHLLVLLPASMIRQSSSDNRHSQSDYCDVPLLHLLGNVRELHRVQVKPLCTCFWHRVTVEVEVQQH